MPIRVLVLRGCLMEMGISIEWTVTTALAAPGASTGLSLINILQVLLDSLGVCSLNMNLELL